MIVGEFSELAKKMFVGQFSELADANVAPLNGDRRFDVRVWLVIDDLKIVKLKPVH